VFVNEPNADVRVSTGVNLGFVVVKHGNDFIIWTPRKASDAELLEIKTMVAAEGNKVGDMEFSQILQRPHTNVYGVPSNEIRKGNMTASVYMDGDEVVVHFGNKNWSQLAWGQLAYTYTPGRADLINTQNVADLEFYKKWINAAGGEAEWDKDIQVTVGRNGDDSFSLVYNLAKTDIVDGNIISPTPDHETDPKIRVSVTENEGVKIYKFTVNGLEFADENGEKYTYTVTETNEQLEGYLAPTYSNTSAPTGAAAAYDKGTIINQEPGVELPSTGGPGTKLFTILGSILIAGAGKLLWRRRGTI
jgi:LPXTG-motif cell wall-anchored protein